MLLPPALGFSPHPPVSVCGTGTNITYTKLFSPPSKLASLLNFGPLRPTQPTVGLGYVPVSLYLTTSVATESLPYVHRLRLSASP